jgi:four helix bundle protein
MATIRRFEDITAWQKARALTREIYNVSSNSKFRKDFVLRDQMRRACISIVSNIAEGFSRRGNKEFVRFLDIAHASTAELQAQLYVAFDQSYLNTQEFEKLYELAEEVSKLIKGLMNYLQKTLNSQL